VDSSVILDTLEVTTWSRQFFGTIVTGRAARVPLSVRPLSLPQVTITILDGISHDISSIYRMDVLYGTVHA